VFRVIVSLRAACVIFLVSPPICLCLVLISPLVCLCLGSLIVFDLLVHQTEADAVSSSTSVSEMVHTSDVAIVSSASGPPVDVYI